MSAKDMFKKLDFELTGQDECFITYTKIALINYDIVFCIYEKCVEVVPTIKELPHHFSRIEMPLLKAITQQCKELGWVD